MSYNTTASTPASNDHYTDDGKEITFDESKCNIVYSDGLMCVFAKDEVVTA